MIELQALWYRSKVFTWAYERSHMTRRTSDGVEAFSEVTLVARTNLFVRESEEQASNTTDKLRLSVPPAREPLERRKRTQPRPDRWVPCKHFRTLPTR
jgi:hypothetical protein